MNKLLHSPLILLSGIICALTWSADSWGYEAQLHQQLTFIAARQYNRCAQDNPQLARLSALDTRYIVKANVAQADANIFVRMFRWNYYNRKDQSNRSTLGMIETRFHERFEGLAEELLDADESHRHLRNLGRIVNYLQDVTAPAHVVPVYTGRWWRFSLSDRFNRFPIDAPRVEQLVAAQCHVLDDAGSNFTGILKATADTTLAAVQSQIYDFPTTWEAYWKLARDAEDFGEYGRAGNQFGNRTEFRCGDGQRCLLLENDPLYQDFATQQHVAAVLASMRSFRLLQDSQRQLAARQALIAEQEALHGN